jgi:hypothetical protein
MMNFLKLLGIQFLFFACTSAANNNLANKAQQNIIVSRNSKDIKVIHVFVALCDNKYQGIVPVPKGIGNGQDAKSNLYWATAYGVKTFFSKQAEWQKIQDTAKDSILLNRVVYKHKYKNIYLVADAYNGKYIKQCTIDFLESSAGIKSDSIQLSSKTIYIAGSSQLISYIGHDGLMDFSLENNFKATDSFKRETIILACVSKKYFATFIKNTNAKPLVWSTGLMSPEAYTLEAAIDGWINNESNEQIRERAAQAYHKYQRCGINAARKLLVTGW